MEEGAQAVLSHAQSPVFLLLCRFCQATLPKWTTCLYPDAEAKPELAAAAQNAATAAAAQREMPLIQVVYGGQVSKESVCRSFAL
jgi:hypothetical protein